MMAFAEPRQAAQDVTKMTKLQKLSAFLVIIGPENAAEIIKTLDQAELEAVSGEMARITFISPRVQTEILRELAEIALQAKSAVRGGPSYTQTVLEKALGPDKASAILGRVSPQSKIGGALQQLVEMDVSEIFNFIKQEQPQTIALITSCLPPQKASQLLQLLNPEMGEAVVERLATLSSVPVEVVEKMIDMLRQKVGGSHRHAVNPVGGLNSAANVLKALDKSLSRSLLLSLGERNPELAHAIRQKMFTFEDLAKLDPVSLQKILREVDMRDLAIALKTVSDRLKGALFACISKRAGEILLEEINFESALKLKDIEVVQQRILEVVHRLAAEGEIELDGERKSYLDEVAA